jgi:hypothetical protein
MVLLPPTKEYEECAGNLSRESLEEPGMMPFSFAFLCRI